MKTITVEPRKASGPLVKPAAQPLRLPTVCMVTSAYAPEVSGGSVQARTLTEALRGRIRCVVVTTTTDRTLAAVDTVNDIPVHRIYVDPRHDLVVALRWVSGDHFDGFISRLLAGVSE